MIKQDLRQEITVRQLFAWAFYDFANSGFSTVVITAVFSAYFVSVVVANADWGPLLWTTALSISYFLNLITAPVLGMITDLRGNRKSMLALSTIGCCCSTALLSIVGGGDVTLSIVLIILANFFFCTGENLIAAFLPEIAREDSLGKVSGWGWAIGYLGGLTTLLISLFYLTSGFFIEPSVGGTMIITALIFSIASLPCF